MIEKALKKLSRNVDEAEVFKIESKNSTIKTIKYSIDTFRENKAHGFGIRVVKNKRMGFYFSNNLDEKALSTVVKVAKIAQRDEHTSLPKGGVYKKTRPPALKLEVEEGIRMAQALVSPGKGYEEVNPTSGIVNWSTSNITICNSNGIYGSKEEALLTVYLGTVARGAEPATGFHYEASRKKDIDAHEVGDLACKLARDSLNTEHLKTGRRRVILHPMAVTELLEYTLIPSFSADNVQRGRSKLGGMVGQKIFAGFEIADDATVLNGLMTGPFDDEGVSSNRTSLVKKGVLKGFLYDTYTANKEGRKSTGNGQRSSNASLPSIGPSNFVISGDETIENEDDALVVHGLIGAHTSNPISGDFSCETKNAFLNGKSIKKAIVSGNIFEILKSGIKFGSDVKQYSSVLSPSIEIPEIMVVG
jgi:PmbA protein